MEHEVRDVSWSPECAQERASIKLKEITTKDKTRCYASLLPPGCLRRVRTCSGLLRSVGQRDLLVDRAVLPLALCAGRMPLVAGGRSICIGRLLPNFVLTIGLHSSVARRHDERQGHRHGSSPSTVRSSCPKFCRSLITLVRWHSCCPRADSDWP